MKGINLIIIFVILFNLLNSGIAYAQSNEVNLEFNYDLKTESYYENLSSRPVAGGRLNILYNRERKEVLFKNQSVLWIRYSYDGWKTCQDTVMEYDETGKQFAGSIDIPEYANYISIAFFSTYENKRRWHVLWDSKYGENFYVRFINSRDLEDKKKFEMLNQS